MNFPHIEPRNAWFQRLPGISMGMLFWFLAAAVMAGAPQHPPTTDEITTSGGKLKLTLLTHASVMLEYQTHVIYVDPVQNEDITYETRPKADVILITHEHGDHLDTTAIRQLMKPGTVLVGAPSCTENLPIMKVIRNGEHFTLQGIVVSATAAYNIRHERSPGVPFHPKGVGNGYILTFGNTRVYIAGDTELIPEMKQLPPVDIAFLPMNLPYTMSPEMMADAARTIHPKILYPYHFGYSDLQRIATLLKGTSIAVRFRSGK